MKIDISKITERQKLTIETALCEYRYIMNHWNSNDSDFQKVFYDFYMTARFAVMSKPGNTKPYFDKLQSITPHTELCDILEDLKVSMDSHSYEFSLGTKLLHTRNPQLPIYDSKVRMYLSAEENISFWWNQSGAPRGTTAIDKINHDWLVLRSWYESFLTSDRGIQWIGWFDANFPAYSHISDVKKIDFIIFATN